MESLQEFIIAIMEFINNVLIPFIFGLALLFFVWNAFRFFILGAEDKDAKEKARSLALYSVAAFVFLVSIWGVVNLLVNGLDIGGDDPIRPDYVHTDPFLRENLNTRDYCDQNPMALDCR